MKREIARDENQVREKGVGRNKLNDGRYEFQGRCKDG